MKKKGLHGRGLTSLLSFVSFLIMTVTGLVLYFVPEGRVAYWVDWTLWGLTKVDWGNIHIISSIVFAVSGLFHIYLNWRPLMNYLAGKVEGVLKYKRELALALTAGVLMVVGSIMLFPPFDSVIAFSKYLKEAWIESKDYEPPFGHAEDVPLKIFTKKMDIDLEKACVELTAQGIIVESTDAKLKDIATANNMTPMDVYVVIKKFEPTPVGEDGPAFTGDLVEEKYAGTGIGRKEFSRMVEDVGIAKALAIKRLADKNIRIADDETLKEAGERYGIDPIEILKVMLVADYEMQQ